MSIHRIGHILPKQKLYLQIFYMLYCTWQTTWKLIRNSKIVWGKSTHFCLESKIWIGHWDPRFTIRSKIHVFSDTILQVLLILIANRNCVWKSIGLIWPFLEITSLKWGFTAHFDDVRLPGTVSTGRRGTLISYLR